MGPIRAVMSRVSRSSGGAASVVANSCCVASRDGAVWQDFQRQWTTQRLPSLIAAIRLALEVYDTFGPGMIKIDNPIEVGIWNNKYFVWERALNPALKG